MVPFSPSSLLRKGRPEFVGLQLARVLGTPLAHAVFARGSDDEVDGATHGVSAALLDLLGRVALVATRVPRAEPDASPPCEPDAQPASAFERAARLAAANHSAFAAAEALAALLPRSQSTLLDLDPAGPTTGLDAASVRTALTAALAARDPAGHWRVAVDALAGVQFATCWRGTRSDDEAGRGSTPPGTQPAEVIVARELGSLRLRVHAAAGAEALGEMVGAAAADVLFGRGHAIDARVGMFDFEPLVTAGADLGPCTYPVQRARLVRLVAHLPVGGGGVVTLCPRGSMAPFARSILCGPLDGELVLALTIEFDVARRDRVVRRRVDLRTPSQTTLWCTPEDRLLELHLERWGVLVRARDDDARGGYGPGVVARVA